MAPSKVSHYELISKIAEGGMGVVYKARDIRLDRLVALKFLSPNLSVSKDRIEQFFHEARAISKLNHPNIATIFEIDETGEEPFLAFEYLPGGTLREKIRDEYAGGRRMTVRKIVSRGLAVARSLAHAHRHGIVHRDVKTDNALLSEEETVKLTDFGVSQVGGHKPASHEDLTVGTAAYMAPEQAQGLEVDHRSDIFSFGAVLYELASGRVPFTGAAQAVVLYEIVHSDPRPLSEIRGDLPDTLAELVPEHGHSLVGACEVLLGVNGDGPLSDLGLVVAGHLLVLGLGQLLPPLAAVGSSLCRRADRALENREDLGLGAGDGQRPGNAGGLALVLDEG